MGRRKRRIATIDAETDPFKYMRKPEPFCWGFYDGETYVQFWGDDSTRQLIEYLEDESDIIIYAHNGGKFDFFYLIPYLDPDLFIINGRIAKATLFDGRVELRDSWLILPLPLAAHQKDTISYELFERDVREQYKQEILRYLQSDCIYLWEWVTDFVEQFGQGLTLAGTAFKELKKTDYLVDNTYDAYDSELRPFYYGGRVQCFETGSFYGDFQYVDINSAYPYAMMFPHWQGPSYVEGVALPESENGSWFAHITARSRGALPCKIDGKLYFPDDGKVREYYASGWEIITGLETGTLEIVKVHRVLKPTMKASFTEYVEKFFALKAEADAELAIDPTNKRAKAKRQFAKLMLNSCYGKFGQDGRDFEKFSLQEFGEWPEHAFDWEPYETFIEGYQLFCRPDPVDRFYNVATAASITGFVRAYLWESLNSCEQPLYCDTDSIICKSFHGKMGKKLGEWDLEASPVEAHIGQRKMYGLKMADGEEKVASKGVRLTFDQIKSGIQGRLIIETERDAPAFSLKYGPRFFSRKTDFSNIEKNSLTSPLELG